MDDDKARRILERAEELRGRNATETFSALAKWLNAHGMRSAVGAPYKGGRGVAKLVDRAYDHVERRCGKEAAQPIAQAFTDRHGRYAYRS